MRRCGHESPRPTFHLVRRPFVPNKNVAGQLLPQGCISTLICRNIPFLTDAPMHFREILLQVPREA
jgi:hypothetical protein